MHTVKIRMGNLEIEVTGGVKEVMEACNEFAVLNETSCGACGSGSVSPQHRRVPGTDENGRATIWDYYSFRCGECNAELKIGERKDKTGFYPKRKDRDGSWLENKGWVVYRGGGGGSQQSSNSAFSEETERF